MSNDLELAMPTEGCSYPLKVQYCGLCHLPVEYCSFSGDAAACQVWLEKNVPDLFAQLHVTEEGEQRVEGEEDVEDKKKTKRGGKGNKKAAKVCAAAESSTPSGPVRITVQRSMRGKSKSVTVIKGMLSAGVDVKTAAKAFSKKFACSSSATGIDEIVVQGDVKDDLLDFIPATWPQVLEANIQDLGDLKR